MSLQYQDLDLDEKTSRRSKNTLRLTIVNLILLLFILGLAIYSIIPLQIMSQDLNNAATDISNLCKALDVNCSINF